MSAYKEIFMGELTQKSEHNSRGKGWREMERERPRMPLLVLGLRKDERLTLT